MLISYRVRHTPHTYNAIGSTVQFDCEKLTNFDDSQIEQTANMAKSISGIEYSAIHGENALITISTIEYRDAAKILAAKECFSCLRGSNHPATLTLPGGAVVTGQLVGAATFERDEQSKDWCRVVATFRLF